ncbi:hypothetical protein [Lusitaniella coriacea]|uniref:hypothetical protein n=1 Tax=Lusitaniella coriacea TaxID=1983105 RepID=UPI003CF607A2
MPNGGSDCCGTCWFNAKNKGESGYKHLHDREPNYCIIRQLEIENPMYTYCANHPRRLPDRFSLPIGPVFIGDSSGWREVWKPAPDTKEIRLVLLDIVSRIVEQPATEYPIGIYLDELVIWQLGEFKEQRAVEHLQRIIHFDPNTESGNAFHRTRHSTVRAARVALEKILRNE